MKAEENKRRNFINEWKHLDMGNEELERFTQELDEVSRERILEFLVHYDSVMYPAIMSEYDNWLKEQEEQ